MTLEPRDLVAFGDAYDWPAEGERPPVPGVALRALPGPTLPGGAVVVADPWWPENQPTAAHCQLPPGGPVTLGVLQFPQLPGPLACSAVIGQLDRVLEWRPLVVNGEQVQLNVDSALGAFYDIADLDALKPLFSDDEYMLGVHERALGESVVAIDLEGRVAAVVFMCGMCDGLYPVYVGHAADGSSVAVLVDLALLLRAGARSAPADGGVTGG